MNFVSSDIRLINFNRAISYTISHADQEDDGKIKTLKYTYISLHLSAIFLFERFYKIVTTWMNKN